MRPRAAALLSAFLACGVSCGHKFHPGLEMPGLGDTNKDLPPRKEWHFKQSGAPIAIQGELTSPNAANATCRLGPWPWDPKRGSKHPTPAEVTRVTGVGLKLISAGHGTTGTHSYFYEYCAMGFRAWHWDLLCNPTEKLAYEVDGVPVPVGALIYQESSSSKEALRSLQMASYKLLSDIKTLEVEALVDSPVYFYFDSLRLAYPEALVVLSVRDSDEWLRSRVQHHGKELVCRESIMNSIDGSKTHSSSGDPPLTHPFNLEACVKRATKQAASQGALPLLSPLVSFLEVLQHPHGKVALKTAYKEYNNYVQSTVPPHQLLVMDVFEEDSCVMHDRIETFTNKTVDKAWRGTIFGLPLDGTGSKPSESCKGYTKVSRAPKGMSPLLHNSPKGLGRTVGYPLPFVDEDMRSGLGISVNQFLGRL